MKKKEIVKQNNEFQEIINNKNYVKNDTFNIYIRKRKANKPRFGIAISKKNGNAVIRNKLKRRTRAILDLTKQDFPNSYDYIIMIKKKCVSLTYQEMHSKLIELIKEIK